MHVAEKRLVARVDHLHRPPRAQGEHGAVDLHREVLAAAEGAADAGKVDPNLLGLEAEARRDLVPVDVEPLRGDVDVDAPLPVRDGEARLGTEEGLVLDAELVVPLDGHVAPGVRVPAPDDDVADDVRARVVAVPVPIGRTLGVQRRLLEGALHVHHGLERLVLDDDPCRGSPRLLRLLGGDERDRLAVEAHALGGEHGLVGELEPVGLAAGDVGLRQNGVHSRHGHGGRHVDRNGCVRARAGCGPCVPRACRPHRGRSRTRTRR